MGIILFVLAFGFFFTILPWLTRIPVLGPLLASGTRILPGQAAGGAMDNFGTVG